MTARSIPELLREVRAAHADRPAFRFKREGTWRDWDWARAEAECRRVSRALLSLGLERGERMAIMSHTRLEWVLADLGIVGCGGTTVGIYPSSSAADCAHILDHCEAETVLVDDSEQLAKVRGVRAGLPHLRRIVLLDGTSDPGSDVLAWDDLLRRAEEVPEARLEARQAEIGPDDVASIVYTSGTTGTPKGAMLTHGNLLFVAGSAREALRVSPGGIYLLFLPLAHVFARLTVHLCLSAGNTIAFAEGIHKATDNLHEVRPNFLAGVPRVYEKIHHHILAEVHKKGALRERIFHWALDVGLRASRLEQQRRRLPPALAIRRALAQALVFRTIQSRLGGRVEFLISGAAPLDQAIAEFFHACGILILEGIGMTENSSFSNVNRRDHFKFGSVGQPGPGIEVRLAPDGEVLVRGPNVMKGYFKDPPATAEAIDRDGWLHTGDVGEIDAEGFLRITDRKKDLIVTSGGKNVAPQRLERALASSLFISQAAVFGDRRKFITALVTLDPEHLRSWAAERGKEPNSLEHLSRDPDLRAVVEAEVEAANAHLASYETVKKVRILPGEFTIEAGELTPTLKIRRKFLAQKYHQLIEEMYQE